MKKKIVMIAKDLGFSGTERVVCQISNMLSDVYDVYIITLDKFIFDAYPINSNITRITLDFPYISRIIKFIQNNNIDLVIDHYHWGIYHIQFLKELQNNNIKHIILDHSSFLFPMFIRKPILHLIRKNVYSKVNLIVALTSFTEAMYKQNGQKNVYTIPNPLSYSSNKYTEHKNHNLIAVGNFTRKEKGLTYLLKIYKLVYSKNKNIKLNIVGKTPKNINDLIEKHNITDGNIILHGVVRNTEELYCNSSILIMTSLIEGFGLVLTEAGMHGLARVAFDIGGLDDIIDNNHDGFLIKTKKCELFADTILRLTEDNILLKKISDNAKNNTLTHFSEPTIKRKWVNIIESVINDDYSFLVNNNSLPTIYNKKLAMYNKIIKKHSTKIVINYWYSVILYWLVPIGSYRKLIVLFIKNFIKHKLNK